MGHGVTPAKAKQLDNHAETWVTQNGIILRCLVLQPRASIEAVAGPRPRVGANGMDGDGEGHGRCETSSWPLNASRPRPPPVWGVVKGPAWEYA